MNKALVLGLIFLSSVSFAQSKLKRTTPPTRKPATVAAPEATSSASMQTVAATPELTAGHLSVGPVLTSSSTLEGATIKTGTGRSSADLNTDFGLGVTGRYQSELTRTLDWDVALTLYNSRDIDGLTSKIAKGTFNSKPSYMPLIVSGGVQYRFNNRVYAPVGLNYSIYNNTGKGDFDSMSMDPRFGFQFGLGARVERNFAVEMTYQRVAYYLDAKKGSTKVDGEVHNEGFNLQGLYIF